MIAVLTSKHSALIMLVPKSVVQSVPDKQRRLIVLRQFDKLFIIPQNSSQSSSAPIALIAQ